MPKACQRLPHFLTSKSVQDRPLNDPQEHSKEHVELADEVQRLPGHGVLYPFAAKQIAKTILSQPTWHDMAHNIRCKTHDTIHGTWRKTHDKGYMTHVSQRTTYYTRNTSYDTTHDTSQHVTQYTTIKTRCAKCDRRHTTRNTAHGTQCSCRNGEHKSFRDLALRINAYKLQGNPHWRYVQCCKGPLDYCSNSASH